MAAPRRLGGGGPLPLAFEPNQGQADPSVKFLARGGGYGLFLTASETVLVLAPATRVGPRAQRPGPVAAAAPTAPAVVRMRFVGADPNADIEGVTPLPGRSHYGGDLVIATSAGDLRLRRPVIYQDDERGRSPVDRGYVVGGRRVRFRIAAWDTTRPLIIDPVLGYSTYLGGASNDQGRGVAVDTTGNAYVTGSTISSDFPISPGALQSTRCDRRVRRQARSNRHRRRCQRRHRGLRHRRRHRHGFERLRRHDRTGVVSLQPASAVIRIPLQVDPGAQPLKAFSVILTNPRGGATLGPQSTAEVRITDTR